MLFLLGGVFLINRRAIRPITKLARVMTEMSSGTVDMAFRAPAAATRSAKWRRLWGFSVTTSFA
jgi:HAMP domain-containing protein